jgi:hypothetical protein
MNLFLNQKIALITAPGALIDNAALTTVSIDTKGWNRCDIYVVVGATDIAMAVLKLQQSDDDGSTDPYADVSNLNFATGTLQDGTAAVLPAASGAFGDNTVHACRVDLRGKKRYLDLSATGGDGSVGAYIMAFAILSEPSIAPSTAAERGVAQELFG